jgi:DNA-binding GntR family transcriptional regulator
VADFWGPNPGNPPPRPAQLYTIGITNPLGTSNGQLLSKANDKAYELIREEILSGRLGAGEHLPEQRIAALTGVSRTPVREALRRLHSERFVRYIPNKGAYVAAWSEEDVADIFELRIMLEGHAAARAATRIDVDQLTILARCAAQIDELLAAGNDLDYDRLLKINHRFHNTLIEAAGSPRLRDLLHSLLETPMILRTMKHYSLRDLARSNQHHAEMVEACRARDAEWARSVMTAHLRAARRALEV